MNTKALFLFFCLLFFSRGYKTQPLVNCANLWLSQDTFYLTYGQNPQVIGDLHYMDTNMVVYPVLRLLLQDTSVVKPLHWIVLSSMVNPWNTVDQFIFNMQFKTSNFPNNSVVKGLFHIYDSDMPGDSIATCYFPITLILQHPVGVEELHPDSYRDTGYRFQVWPNPADDLLELKIEDYGLKIGNAKIKVFNSLGQLVKDESLAFDENAASLKTNDLERGAYFLEIRTSSGLTINKRFLIAR